MSVIAENTNRCVCCGDEIPEGSQFCKSCWTLSSHDDYNEMLAMTEVSRIYNAKMLARKHKIESIKAKCISALGFLIPRKG